MFDYQIFHAACLDPMAIAASPGDLIIAASEPMALVGFEPDHLGLMGTGAPLFVEAAAPSLRAAIERHCFGLGTPSAFRIALAERMSLPLVTLDDQRNAKPEIDAWIAQYTLVRVRLHPQGETLPEYSRGWLNPPTVSPGAALEEAL